MTRSRQHEIWESEHAKPSMFTFVASETPNPGVVQFWDWLESNNADKKCGLEICCGKGRNAIWLAGQGSKMQAFDFSSTAIEEAKLRQSRLQLPDAVEFSLQNAMERWAYESSFFDFVIDCFGTSDIEAEHGRVNVLSETLRVLKPGGYYFLQIDSPEMGFFAELYESSPGPDKSSVVFPNGKIESILTESDIADWDHELTLVEVRPEIETTLEIYGQTKPYKYFWIVMQSPPQLPSLD